MKNKNKIGSVAEVAGMAAIAGVEIGMALRDKKTREKVKKMLVNVKNQAIDYVKTLEIEVNSGTETSVIKKHATKK